MSRPGGTGQPDGDDPAAAGGGPRSLWLPRLFLRLSIADPDVREGVVGDLEEAYDNAVQRRSRARAAAGYWYSTLLFGGAFLLERWRAGARASTRAERRVVPGILAPRRGDSPMKTVFRDLRHAARCLLQQPVFTLVAVVTLALGIGATTAIFALLDAVVLSPLPFEQQDRLVDVGHTASARGILDLGQCAAWHFAYEDHAEVFDAIGMYTGGPVAVRGDGPPEALPAMFTTSGLFRALRVQAVAGRVFDPQDEDPDAPAVVMLGYGYWQSRYGGDPDVVGRTLQTDGVTREIVGVAPASIRSLGRDPALVLPLRFRRENLFVGNIGMDAVARLRDGVTLEQALADAARVMPMAWEMFPGGPVADSTKVEDYAPVLVPLKEELVGSSAPVLWILLGGVGVVFLVACANVANLFLARSEERSTEMAVRTALGAGRARVGWEYLKESLLIGLMGGALGLAVASGGLGALIANAPGDTSGLADVSLSPAVFGFTLCLSLGAGAFFGMFPVLRHRRRAPVDALRQGGGAASQGRERARLQSALAVSQVAFVLVLLVVAGLLLRSFQALRHVEAGFADPQELLALRVSIPSAEIGDIEEAALAFELMARRLGEISGVEAAGMATPIPMDGSAIVNPFYAEGVPPDGAVPSRRHKWVGEGYFETMRIPVIVGRTFTWDDVHNRFPGAILSESMAREYFGSAQAAIGRRVAARPDPLRWHEIVGVVADVRDDGMNQAPPLMVYWPQVTLAFWQGSPADGVQSRRTQGFVVRSARVGSAGFLDDVRAAIWSVNPNVPVRGIAPMTQLMAASTAVNKFALVLLAAAAGAALILGVVGVYGVISYGVSQRRRELGMRVALGAQGRDLTRLVLRQALLVAALGVALGLAAAYTVTGLLSSLLYEVSPTDPMTYGVVTAILLAAALLAGYAPARRAARVDVMRALSKS